MQETYVIGHKTRKILPIEAQIKIKNLLRRYSFYSTYFAEQSQRILSDYGLGDYFWSVHITEQRAFTRVTLSLRCRKDYQCVFEKLKKIWAQ